jgi:hypothetical protein
VFSIKDHIISQSPVYQIGLHSVAPFNTISKRINEIVGFIKKDAFNEDIIDQPIEYVEL